MAKKKAVVTKAAAASTLRPLDDRVIVKPDEALDMTPGGILLPDSSTSEKPQVGSVIAVGPGKKAVASMEGFAQLDPLLMPQGKSEFRDPRLIRVPMDVKVGDRVVFNRYAGCVVPGFKEFIMMREDDVLAVVE